MSDRNWRRGNSNAGGRPRSDPILAGRAHFKLADPYWLPSAAPVAGRLVIVTGNSRIAKAAAISVQVVARDLISDPLDQRTLATWAICRLLFRRFNVADIRII